MGLLGSLIGTAFDLAVLPVRVAVDVATLPAPALDPKAGPFDATKKGLEDLKDDLL